MKYSGILLAASLSFTSSAFAVNINWTDWESFTSNTASGSLLVDSQAVAVNYSATSNHGFVQTGTGTGRNYWSGTAYTNGIVDNAPTPAELVALRFAGTVTINFSETIKNPVLALNSWNRNVVKFNTPINIDSFGQGYWGNGSAILNTDGDGFTGNGEFHGIIALTGNYDSITFTHTSENWHGFTVGVEGIAEIPIPAAFWLFGSALLGLFNQRNSKKAA